MAFYYIWFVQDPFYKKHQLNLTPIIITSPVRRSGTTLLQRLLSSASNTLIYGENSANDINFFSNLIASKEMLFRQTKDWRNEQLSDVLKGNVNQWIPDLMPEIDGYLAAYRESALTMLAHYAQFAAEQGKPVWGVKLPEWNPQQLLQVKQLLPDAKIIYLHRNLKDCLRSAKSIQMVQNLNEVKQFCHTWQQYSKFAKQYLNSDNVLHLQYEELIANPKTGINTLADFSGARDIVSQVMEVKVNTFASDHKLDSNASTSYLKPQDLSKEEQALVQEYSSS